MMHDEYEASPSGPSACAGPWFWDGRETEGSDLSSKEVGLESVVAESDWDGAVSDPYGGGLSTCPATSFEPQAAAPCGSQRPVLFPQARFRRPAELAAALVEGVIKDEIVPGFESLLGTVKHNASQDALFKSSDLFPLPVDWNPDGSGLLGRPAGVQAWLPLVCHALNLLAGCKKKAPSVRKGAQVKRVVTNLESRIGRFLGLFSNEDVDPETVWNELKVKKLSYEGEEFSEPVPLKVSQILKSLPPLGHGGSVELAPLLEGHTRWLIEHPEAVLRSHGKKEAGPNSARVHILAGEELPVWRLLEERGIITWMELDKVYTDQDGPFLSGLFGVPKAGRSNEAGELLLRVIMNLKPINRAMNIVAGDIGELPSATAWMQLQVNSGEHINISQSDMSNAFYLFRLPSSWQRYMCFNTKLAGQKLGLDPSKVYVPSCQVLPMGW